MRRQDGRKYVAVQFVTEDGLTYGADALEGSPVYHHLVTLGERYFKSPFDGATYCLVAPK